MKASATPPAPRSGAPSSTVADENIRTVARLQQQAAQGLTPWQRLADFISSLAARDSTIAWHIVFFAGWIAINLPLVGLRPFDPFPFTLLTTLVSLEAIFLTLFVLASQKRLTQDADRRAHLDLQVNLLAEQEMTVVLQMLREICQHLGLNETIQSPKFMELVKRTDVGKLADHVERAIGAKVTAQPDNTRRRTQQ